MDQSKLEKHYFISCSRKDLDIARQLKEDLERKGFEVWMDEYDITVGTRWDDAIEENIRRSIAVLYLVSPTSRTSRYIDHELEYAKIYKKNIIPLWVRGDTEWAKVVAFGISTAQYIDLRGNLYETGMERLAKTLTNLLDIDPRFTRYIEEDDDDSLQKVENVQLFDKEEEMSEDAYEIDQPQRNPYKGLHAFEYEDSEFFFGRKNLIDGMVQQVKEILGEERRNSQASRCMMVVGASGSGKSSVVMAGLLPALEDKKGIIRVRRWFFLEPVRPGEDPMNALARTLRLPFLNETEVGSSPLRRRKLADVRRTLDEPEARGLKELLQEITDSPGDRIVLIVDQFEEIFAPPVNAKQREQFVHLLTATATEPDTPILLLFTLRADFFHRLLDSHALYKMVEGRRIDIPPMSREELRAVIEKPVEHPDVSVTFDPHLAEELLYKVYKRPESLPLLQFTLEQLFERRDRKGRRLTRQSYDEIGGLEGAIDRHAEYIYHYRLPTSQHQAEARRLFAEHFIYITEADDETSRLESGEGITRRRVTRVELQLSDSQLSIRRETIDAFVEGRLLTATSTVRQSTDLEIPVDITYEISHEVLINAWERLREWIKQDRRDISLIQSLRPQIKRWDEEKSQKEKKELLVEKLALQQLQDYSERKKLEQPMHKFLEASLAQQRRQNIQKYTLFVGFAALLILSFVLEPIIHNVLFPDPTVVTSLADSGPGTLAYALQKASDGATITFDAGLAGKTIYLAHSGLDINKSITIHGPTAGINITSGSTGNHIQIEAGQNVTIENMLFMNSYTLKHSIIENNGNLIINNSIIKNNKNYNDGGAIYNTGNLTLTGDTLEENIVSSNGGAIYNLFGTVNINYSTVSGNKAYGNGGGIYSQGGVVTVGGIDRSHTSIIENNSADDNAGGGIDMLNGLLSMHDARIEDNQSDDPGGGIGGGIAIQGSVAFITTSVITGNIAGAQGGGIVVAEDPDNGASSLLKLQGIIRTDQPGAVYYYIGQNTGGSNDDKDIAGIPIKDTNLQVSADPNIDNFGSPPPSYPIEKFPNYLGVANINAFCLNKGGSYGKISTHADRNATDIMFTCINQSNTASGSDFSGQAICQFQYSGSPGVDTVIDRMANYYDPTSLQCYKNLNRIRAIGKDGFTNYCAKQSQYSGLFDDLRTTAYDWLCQPKDTSKLPSGLSVTDACNLQYRKTDAIDRLVNFNSPDGWECWEPA